MTTTDTPTESAETSPFLRGLLAPVADERDLTDLEIEGELPAALRGVFLRNGPNPMFPPAAPYHPFDGDGMLHGVYLEGGGARYKNRWVRNRGLEAERKRGQVLYGGLGAFRMPDADVIAEAGIIKNTANTSTVRHGGRLFALMEAAPPTEVSRELDTIGEWTFDGRLAGPMTAHPKIDPVTGEMLFFGYSPLPPFLRYHVVDPEGALVHSVDLDLPAPVMMHDFAVTENHVLFLDSPAVFDVHNFMAGGPALKWSPDNGTRLGVLPRRGGADDIVWHDIDTCYIVHFFNAWEDDGRIEIRAPRFSAMPGGFEFDHPTGREAPVPWRWSLDLASGQVTHEQTDDRPGEFPRVNDDHATRATRYLYNATARSWELEFEFNGVVKYDLHTGAVQSYEYGDTEVSGEHVFAPDPERTDEDAGWLLTMVADRATDTSFLSVLDATDLGAGPVAKVRIPCRVPLGFHANWFADR